MQMPSLSGSSYYDVGVKRYFDPYDTTDCSAFHAPAILKHLKSAHFSTKNGYFSVFCGSQVQKFSCKPACIGFIDLLTLVSYDVGVK